jgi:pimeloyl-ACP methyl ester carboxylesterase
MSTVATARDMDLLREALGEEQISYLGQSYGAGRGPVYATLFPERVRAMVLDGGIDLDSDMDQRRVWDALAQERVLNTALGRCAADPSCAFHTNGDPYTAFDDLMASLDAEPLIVDGTEVGLAEALFAVQLGLYHEEWWPDLMQTLADVRDGDGTWLALFHEQPGEDANMAGSAVMCLDAARRSDEIPQPVVEEVLAVAPRLGPYRLGRFDVCSVWPVEPDLPPPVTSESTGPILVLGTTGSPWIAIERNHNLVQQLDNAVLLVVERYAKYAYWTLMWDQDKAACVHTAVERHLIDRDPPEHLSVCKVGDPELHPPD